MTPNPSVNGTSRKRAAPYVERCVSLKGGVVDMP